MRTLKGALLSGKVSPLLLELRDADVMVSPIRLFASFILVGFPFLIALIVYFALSSLFQVDFKVSVLVSLGSLVAAVYLCYVTHPSVVFVGECEHLEKILGTVSFRVAYSSVEQLKERSFNHLVGLCDDVKVREESTGRISPSTREAEAELREAFNLLKLFKLAEADYAPYFAELARRRSEGLQKLTEWALQDV